MTLQIFAPKKAHFYLGLRVTEDYFHPDGGDLGALQVEDTLSRVLHGHIWNTYEDEQKHISIEQSWGWSRAFVGDFILRDADGNISVVTQQQIYGLGLKALDFDLNSI